MSDYIHSVGDLRKALAEHPDDLPINWYVDVSDYRSRECEGMPILVGVSIIERSDDEMIEAPEHIKPRMLFVSVG